MKIKMCFFKRRKELVWVNRNPLDKKQRKAFEWYRKILLKKEEDKTDHEKEIQKIYTNIVIF